MCRGSYRSVVCDGMYVHDMHVCLVQEKCGVSVCMYERASNPVDNGNRRRMCWLGSNVTKVGFSVLASINWRSVPHEMKLRAFHG